MPRRDPLVRTRLNASSVLADRLTWQPRGSFGPQGKRSGAAPSEPSTFLPRSADHPSEEPAAGSGEGSTSAAPGELKADLPFSAGGSAPCRTE